MKTELCRICGLPWDGEGRGTHMNDHAFVLPKDVQPEQPTLRDRFAMAALTGMLAYSYVRPDRGNITENATNEHAAARAYAYADAMLAARAVEVPA